MRSRAFTLVELLVVISVITVMIAMLMPALSQARESGRNVECMSNIRQVTTTSIQQAFNGDGHLPKFFFDWEPGNSQSGVILIHIKPKWAATTGLNAFNKATLLCPKDENPGTVPVKMADGSIEYWPMSFGYNIDFLMRDILYLDIPQPSELALYYDGDMDGKSYKQGAYHGSSKFADEALVTRHFDRTGNIAFADGHVDTHLAMHMGMILVKGTEAIAGPGNSGGGGNPGRGNPNR